MAGGVGRCVVDEFRRSEVIVARMRFDDRLDLEADSADRFLPGAIVGLDLAAITRQVLGDIDAGLRDGCWRNVRPTLFFFECGTTAPSGI